MTEEESAALAKFWKGNAKLAEAVADQWRDCSYRHKESAAEWRCVAERRIRVGVAYVCCFVSVVAGLLLGLLLAAGAK